MITALIVLLSITAIAGVVLAALHFTNKKIPMGVALFHGIFAVAGLIALILSVARINAMGPLSFALVFIVLAALGGLTLFVGFYLRRKNLPTPIVGLHAAFAVAGFVLVIVYAMAR